MSTEALALFRSEAFEPLLGDEWNEEDVRRRLNEVVSDTIRSYSPDTLWSVAEDWDAGRAGIPVTRLYSGASGVLWALDELRRRGFGNATFDLARAAERVLEAWRAEPDLNERSEPPVHAHASLFDGETGPLLVAWKLTRRRDLENDLFERVRQNWDNPTDEVMIGAPGTMLVAKAMLNWTNDSRWGTVWRESADELLRRRADDGLWTYPPYGKGLGAAHGVGTNTNVLLQGAGLIPQLDLERLKRNTNVALARTAVRMDGLANWPMSAEDYPNLVVRRQSNLANFGDVRQLKTDSLNSGYVIFGALAVNA